MQTATLAIFHTSPPATRLKNWLARAGVPSKVRHHTFQHWWSLAKVPPAVQLDVPKDHVEHATGLLREWDISSKALTEAVRCPACDSLRVKYPHDGGRTFTPALFARALTALGILRHRFHCDECSHAWRAPEAVELHAASAAH